MKVQIKGNQWRISVVFVSKISVEDNLVNTRHTKLPSFSDKNTEQQRSLGRRTEVINQDQTKSKPNFRCRFDS